MMYETATGKMRWYRLMLAQEMEKKNGLRLIKGI